jgi:hypothetical protein
MTEEKTFIEMMKHTVTIYLPTVVGNSADNCR